MIGIGILKGMAVTLRNFAGSYFDRERLITVQYPEERNPLPENYRKLLGEIPSGVNFASRPIGNTRFVHLFATRRSELAKELSILRRKVAEDATVWVSWPKKSSAAATDITEDVVRAVALPLGFVDIKVCAVDDTWSGLKLMIRRENRKSK